MKIYHLDKDKAFVQIALGSADMIRAIYNSDGKMTDPVEIDGEEFLQFAVRDPGTGAIFTLSLPATAYYFEVENALPS